MFNEASRRSLVQFAISVCLARPALATPTSLAVVITGNPDAALRRWTLRLIPYLQKCWPVVVATISDFRPEGQTILSIDFVMLSRQMLMSWTGHTYGTALEHPERVSAVTIGRTIHVNSTYVAPRLVEPDMAGMMVHELVHVVQRYPAGVSPWIKEGLADYVRYYVLRPYDPGRCFDPRSQTYSDGYAPAAGMLDWIAGQHRTAIYRLNRVMRHGGDGEAELQAIAGQPSKSLWDAYLQACPAAGRFPAPRSAA